MEKVCIAQRFATKKILNEQATAGNILDAISDLAIKAQPGDTVVISYSGHGGQVPDTTGTEDDGLSETWVCYDRMMVDKELYERWSEFQQLVHIQVYSDSCHSGTVVRELIIPTGSNPLIKTYPANKSLLASTPSLLRAARAYSSVYKAVAQTNQPTIQNFKFSRRAIPQDLAIQLFYEKLSLYTVVKKPGPIQCGVVLISGCQDNQTSTPL